MEKIGGIYLKEKENGEKFLVVNLNCSIFKFENNKTEEWHPDFNICVAAPKKKRESAPVND